MIKIIDCKGMSCPLPVVNTKKYFDSIESGTAVTIVDNEVAKNNVVKLAQKSGFSFDIEEKDGYFHVKMIKGEASTSENNEAGTNENKNDEKFVIVIGQNKLGHGNDELGEILMKGYIFALSEADIIPTDILFLNSGVKLTVEDSAVLDGLTKLKDKNVNILVCGTCTDFYGVTDKVAIGEISNMYSIVETMNEADKIINI
ncbi:sulfurtransferase-like selenium metabolism protein YedF [Clostridium tepidiprofundi]|nr:sulfurtransferase-like selenium metabolism protein YedF [Clostridium tepidiprofundi]